MIAKSDNPVASLIGYALIAGPFGALLGSTAAAYTTASLVKVIAITGGVTVITGTIGAVIPESLEHWGGWLFSGLLVLLLGSLFVPIAGFLGLPVRGALTALDWVGVVLFSAYIVYDLNRAMRVERTLDNAIDCAIHVYLDVVNLFIRLLDLMGVVKK